MNKASKNRIDVMIAANTAPQRLKGSEGIALRAGRSIVKLIDDEGMATKAGTYWSLKSGQALPAGGFMQQAATREGNVESIRLRDGSRGITRRYVEGTGEYKFTPLGNSYYRTVRRNYVVTVPVIINGKRKDGSTYQIKSTMPVSKLGLKPTTLPSNMTSPQRRAKVRRIVEAELSDVLYEMSDETWTLDGSGSWRIHEEVVATDPDTGTAEAYTFLDRPTGTRPVLANFLFPDALCEEAFEEHDDMLCCPRQMAAVLKLDIGNVCSDLSVIERILYQTDSWQEKGATPRMVLEYCRMHALGAAVVHNEAVVETLPGIPCLAFVVHENHTYFYKKSQVIKMLQQRRTTVVRLKKEQRQTTTPIASEWKPWQRVLQPGHYTVSEEQLPLERAWFLEQGRHPKVLLKSVTEVRSLIYNCTKRADACVGAVTLHSLPDNSQMVAEWVKRLDCGLEYRGEGLPNMALKVLHRLVKQGRERVWLTGEEKAVILEQNEHKCATCSSRGPFEWDHVARHSESYGEQVFQNLCTQCHREKTDAESKTHDSDHLASHLEKRVWEQYVLSPRPPPLVYKLREVKGLAGLEIADVRRCRKRALEFNVHPLPVFCPLDDIKARVEPILGDLNFVTKKYTTLVKQLGYTGVGWQHRVQTEFLLYMRVISWEDISHTLTATAHLPAGLLTTPLRQMEEAWLGDPLAKLAVNSLIGLWAIDQASSHSLQSSNYETDAPINSLKQTFYYQGGCTYDFITSTAILSSSTCRPLHDLCMCTEAVRIGQVIYELQQSRAVIYEFKTDSVLYKPLKRTGTRLATLAFRDLDTLREAYEPRAQKRLRPMWFPEQDFLMTACPSDEKVYRVQGATEGDP